MVEISGEVMSRHSTLQPSSLPCFLCLPLTGVIPVWGSHGEQQLLHSFWSLWGFELQGKNLHAFPRPGGKIDPLFPPLPSGNLSLMSGAQHSGPWKSRYAVRNPSWTSTHFLKLSYLQLYLLEQLPVPGNEKSSPSLAINAHLKRALQPLQIL